MPKPPRPLALEVLRENLLIRVSLPSLNNWQCELLCGLGPTLWLKVLDSI